METLTQVQHKAAETLYKQTQDAGGQHANEPPRGDGAASGPNGGKDEVIDAEVVDDK